MKFSNKQRCGVEKVTGLVWDSWDREVLEAYFLFTDRGDKSGVDKIFGAPFSVITKPTTEAARLGVARF